MTRLYTTAQMRQADRLAVEAGVPSLELMENAGRAVAGVTADVVPARRPGPSDRNTPDVVVLAGKGNNGGDGLVAARLLAARGYRVEVVLTGAGEAFAGDARANLEALAGQGRVRPMIFGRDVDEAALLSLLSRAAVVVDALLGTGARGAPREPAATLINLLERARPPKGEAQRGAGGPGADGHRAAGPEVIAVDVPSGLDADTGRAAGPAVRADATVTFAGVKLGLALPEAASYAGRVHLARIGIPESCLERARSAAEDGAAGSARDAPALHWLLPAEAAAWLPDRPAAGHKGTFGHVWVLAGSPGYTGAAVLTALGALRAGAGLVTAACPGGSRPLVASGLPEALTLALPEGADGRVEATAAAELLAAVGGASGGGASGDGRGARASLVLGPGLGATETVGACVAELVRRSPAPLVVDADALNSLSLRGPAALPRAFEPARGRVVVTPHPGEMSRLTGFGVSEIQDDRIGTATRAARAWGVVVVLKGAGTIVASPEGEAWVNATGNPGMATGGSGDILSGAIGAFLAQGCRPLEAALLGVCLHGLSGDLAAADIGSRGLLARDIAHGLAPAMDALAGADGYGPVLLEGPGPEDDCRTDRPGRET